jgi:peptidoglycan/xylan/chitin deacetylase (PgdA/CDA1 family)
MTVAQLAAPERQGSSERGPTARDAGAGHLTGERDTSVKVALGMGVAIVLLVAAAWLRSGADRLTSPPAATAPEVGSPSWSTILTPEQQAGLRAAVAMAMQLRDEYDWLPDHGRAFTARLAAEEWGTLRHQAYPHLMRGPADRPWASLTFDDGPDPVVTPRVLDALRAAGVKATFFVIGRKAEQYPDLIRRILAEGHELGDHTYDHLYLTRIPPASARLELEACAEVIQHLTGKWPRYYRPPGGHFDRTLVQIGQALHMQLVTWTRSVGDFDMPPEMTLLDRALAATRPGALLIWHDDAPEAADVLPEYLARAKEKGFRFVPLSAYESPGSLAFARARHQRSRQAVANS